MGTELFGIERLLKLGDTSSKKHFKENISATENNAWRFDSDIVCGVEVLGINDRAFSSCNLSGGF